MEYFQTDGVYISDIAQFYAKTSESRTSWSPTSKTKTETQKFVFSMENGSL